LRAVGLFLVLSAGALSLSGREKDASQYGAGLILNVPFPESEVAQVVQDVVQNGIIRGSKEYNKDEYITGAVPVTSTKLFPAWTEGGKVFYKVRLKALDPRNFKDSSDIGTLIVRYVVQPQGDKNTVLRIDAVFVEDFRHATHLSNGSVEGAEYKDIHDRLDAIELMKSQTAEAQKEKQEQSSSKELPKELTEELPKEFPPPSPERSSVPSPVPENPGSLVVTAGQPPSTTPPQTLEEHLQDLRRQVERLVKAPGAPLKSAPFHTATTLHSLPAGTEVLIVISTPYWLGVETHDGLHGWILRDQLELKP
jgi:hypothetical protein